VQPPVPTAIDSLAKQMEDLQLSQARQMETLQISQVRQMEDLRHGQAALLRELSAVKSMNGNVNRNPNGNNPNMNMNANANAATNMSRCFICDTFDLHRLGIRNCQEVERLIEEGLVKFTPSGRLVRPDGSELPRAPYMGGGVAKVLRDERLASRNLKGKAREARDSPPHMAHYASLQTDGEDFFCKDVFAISSSSSYPSAFPVTRSQTKDPRYDPTKGN
jgi:hypothetical protein